MYKSCSKCGKIHDSKYQCTIHNKRVYTTTEERKIRSKYKWTLKSQEVRENARYLCEVCIDNNVITTDNLSVHHITKLKEDSSKAYENENLICLCELHHRQADEGLIDQEYLRILAKNREES